METNDLEQRQTENEAVVDAFEKELKALLSKYPGIIIHCDGQVYDRRREQGRNSTKLRRPAVRKRNLQIQRRIS